jgi:hypothetical protein
VRQIGDGMPTEAPGGTLLEFDKRFEKSGGDTWQQKMLFMLSPAGSPPSSTRQPLE